MKVLIITKDEVFSRMLFLEISAFGAQAHEARELSEETGLSVNPTEHFLTVNEYYEEWHFVSHYFRCEITGETERKLTKRELDVGLVPVWLPLFDAIYIFSKHADYREENEMKRGAYLREYTALSFYVEAFNISKNP